MEIKIFLVFLFILNMQTCFCSDTKKVVPQNNKKFLKIISTFELPAEKIEVEKLDIKILNLIKKIKRYRKNNHASNSKVIIERLTELVNSNINIVKSCILYALLQNKKTLSLLEELFKSINDISRELILNFLNKLKKDPNLSDIKILQNSDVTNMIEKLHNLYFKNCANSGPLKFVLNTQSLQESSSGQQYSSSPQPNMNNYGKHQTTISDININSYIDSALSAFSSSILF